MTVLFDHFSWSPKISFPFYSYSYLPATFSWCLPSLDPDQRPNRKTINEPRSPDRKEDVSGKVGHQKQKFHWSKITPSQTSNQAYRKTSLPKRSSHWNNVQDLTNWNRSTSRDYTKSQVATFKRMAMSSRTMDTCSKTRQVVLFAALLTLTILTTVRCRWLWCHFLCPQQTNKPKSSL